jgi:hypothetical protein
MDQKTSITTTRFPRIQAVIFYTVAVLLFIDVALFTIFYMMKDLSIIWLILAIVFLFLAITELCLGSAIIKRSKK